MASPIERPLQKVHPTRHLTWGRRASPQKHLRGQTFPYDFAYANGLIDARIEPLVTALHDTGLIETIASCGGHGILPALLPYVAFFSTTDVARRLADHIDPKSNMELMLHWTINGTFHPSKRLMFTLSCVPANFRWTSVLRWRRDVSNDIQVLASALRHEGVCSHSQQPERR